MTAPFGVELNTPLTEQIKVAEVAPGKWEVSPPTPHPSFVKYLAENSARYGVVWLKGISSEFENDPYGAEVRAAYDRLASQLSLRYGTGQVVDLLQEGAIWTESRDWIASIYENDRLFWHSWTSDSGSSLPADVESVFLGILAYGHGEAAVFVEYISINQSLAAADSDSDLANLL